MLPVDELREVLLLQRRRLFERVAQAEDDLHFLDTHVAPEREEEGQEANIARLLEQLDDRGKAEIQAIDVALMRMANGEYGRCMACGAAISPERMRAMPTADHCLACARRAEEVRPSDG